MELSHISGFHLTSDLGKYLGVPMLHDRKKKETCAYLLEKTQCCLSRYILAKAVVATLPTYTMQTVLLPK
ncbi:hypothetical protein CR513_39755, partial [Mucuna pruriens]